jgi:serine/threonine protein kinase
MCLIIEKISGIDLFHYIQYYDLSVSHKIKISKSIIETLKYIHSKQIIYRDLKPENIMINLNTLDIKFIDFGMAEKINKPIKGIAGTPGYIAPEILKDCYYSFSADIYSFGMTLFVLWTETNPKKYSIIQHYIRHIPKKFQTIILNCVNINPNNRPSINDIIELMNYKSDISFWNYFCC